MLLALDVAIGLVLTFSLVSLLASLINEWLAGLLKMRGQMLWKAVDDLLGQDLGERIAEHPFLKGLRRRSWLDSLSFWRKETHRNKVAYLPTATFVRTVMAELEEPGERGGASGAGAGSDGAGSDGAGSDGGAKILPALVKEAKGDVEALKKNLAATFDATMNEVSSWYKRWSQVSLFVVGLGIAVFVGVDSVAITQRLATDPELREAVGRQAETVLGTYYEIGVSAAGTPGGDALASSDRAKDEIRSLLSAIEGTGLPLIEPPACEHREQDCKTWERQWGRHWLDHWQGFLLTALATCFGATFWFDLLKRLVNLRVSLKPPEPGEILPL